VHGLWGIKITYISCDESFDYPATQLTTSSGVAKRPRDGTLNILQSHTRSFEMTLLRRACLSSYEYFNDAMSVCRTISDIFSVKEWRDLATRGRVVQGHCKWRHSIYDIYTTFYWSAVVSIAVCCTIFKLFDVD